MLLSDFIGGDVRTETVIGDSYATGSSSAIIVTAGANTAGVRISTVCLEAGDTLIRLDVDGNTLLASEPNNSSHYGACSMSGLLVPAGQEIAIVEGGGNNAEYYISYEVL